MKKISAVAVLGLLLLACGRNPEPHGYALSPDDKAEITGLASAIRDEPVDSIVVEDFSCQVVVPFIGVVYFHPEQIDSDKVVFSRLEFCHVDWPIYSQGVTSSYFFNDSDLTISNGWATSIYHLHCDTALVVRFDACSLSVLYWNHPRKDTVSYYLNKIYNRDYLMYGDTVDMQPLCSSAVHGIMHYWQYSRSDTTFVQLDFSRLFRFPCSGTSIYNFVEINSVLIYMGISHIIP